jgi:tetratricopeptide (TPR) repeat protein
VGPDPHLGRRLGAYEIVDKLGGGGFGNVYRARHVDLGIDRAIKIMQTSLAGQTEFRDRFLHEAKMAARLEHPNIVAVYDYGLEAETQYIVMAFVPSQTLEQRLATRQPIPFEMALRLAREIGSALDYAHGQGIVHRDIKPANVLLREPDGTAMLADFGIARVAGERGLTQTGLAIGTFAYMSPEQCRGVVHELDSRSDIYSFSVMLFQIVSGQLPFGDGPAAVAGHLTHERPAARQFNPYLPDAIDGVLGWGMAREAGDRAASAGELVAAFATAFGESAPALPVPAPGRRAATDATLLIDTPEPEPLDLHQTVAAARERGDRGTAGQGLYELGRRAVADGRYDDARLHWEECLSIWRDVADKTWIATVLSDLGSLVFSQGRYDEAAPYWEESLTMWRQQGDQKRAASLLLEIGRLAAQTGRLPEARRRILQSLSAWRELEDGHGSASALLQLGLVTDLERRAEMSQRILAESALFALEAGDRSLVARAYSNLGRLALESGHSAAARALWTDTIRICAETGDKAEIASLLSRLSAITLAQGETELSLRLGAAAAAHYDSLGQSQLAEAAKASVQPAMGRLPEKTAWQAWNEGWAMTVDQAVMRLSAG